jgi:hypothetical protein
MLRNEFTSIFLPETPIPDPPDWRPFLYMILQIVFIAVLILFIGFLVFETVMDAIGKPIWLGGVDIVKQQTTPPTQEDIAIQFKLISPLPNSRLSKNNVTIICTWQPDPFTRLYTQDKLVPPYVPELFVDERRVDWAVKYDKSWLAQVDLKSGLHNLRAAKSGFEFIVDLPERSNSTDDLLIKPRNKKTNTSINNQQTVDHDYQIKYALWPVMRSHVFIDDADKCTVCHDIVTEDKSVIVSAQKKIIKPINGSMSCVTCHDKNKIHTIHGQKLDIWENCSRCHVLHGTTTGKKGLLRSDFLP